MYILPTLLNKLYKLYHRSPITSKDKRIDKLQPKYEKVAINF